MIITLDSLGQPHSSTSRNLKDYLVEEGRAKRQLEIDDRDISGMTAKGIPLQDNFCDCGVYLLGYMEKFLQNPRLIANKLLQKELDEDEDWPEMRPSKMRNAIRELLIKLGAEQEAARMAAKKDAAKRRSRCHDKPTK